LFWLDSFATQIIELIDAERYFCEIDWIENPGEAKEQEEIADVDAEIIQILVHKNLIQGQEGDISYHNDQS
jgi:hypothetical protein